MQHIQLPQVLNKNKKLPSYLTKLNKHSEDFLVYITSLIDAQAFDEEVEFNIIGNEFANGDPRSDSYVIWGSIKPSDTENFNYLAVAAGDEVYLPGISNFTGYQDPEIKTPVNINGLECDKFNFSDKSMSWRAHWHNEIEGRYIPFGEYDSDLLVNICGLRVSEHGPSWTRFLTLAYQMYTEERFEIAFLLSFAAFDSLIENRINMIIRNKESYAVSSELMPKLEDPSRRLIDKYKNVVHIFGGKMLNTGDFKLLEKVRNSLAHGGSFNFNDYLVDVDTKDMQISIDLYNKYGAESIDFPGRNKHERREIMQNATIRDKPINYLRNITGLKREELADFYVENRGSKVNYKKLFISSCLFIGALESISSGNGDFLSNDT